MQELPPSFAALGASLGDQPVGLVVASVHTDGPSAAKAANLRAVVIDARYRRQGIGSRLLGMLEPLLRENGAAEIRAEYVGPAEPCAVETAFLRSCGFTASTPAIHVWSGPLRKILEDLPRIGRLSFPADFSFGPLSGLSSGERVAITRGKGDWYPPILDPFAEEECIDPEHSLILRYRDVPVGWIILERFDERTVLFKSMFVREKHQRLARAIALGAEASRRIIAEGKLTESIFFVEADNEDMVRFMNRQIDHPSIHKEILWRTVKAL
nr:GNAT family N-acetyltransferase [Fontibacillus phaseoli]